MADQTKSDYEVGYGKPPRHSRFAKGESGNSRGRPKGTRNLSSLLESALSERIVITENGRRRRITKREAVLKQLVNKAASGDPKSIQLLLTEIRLVEGREQAPMESILFDESDRAVIQHFHERLNGTTQTDKENN